MLGLAQGIEHLLVHHHGVFRNPRLHVVVVLQVLEQLVVGAGGAGGDQPFDHARGQGLGQFGLLDGDGLCAHQFTNAGRRGRVHAPLHALEVGNGVDGLLGVDALGRPRHGVQQHLPLLVQQLLQLGLLGLVQLVGLVVVGGQERQAIGAKNGGFVLEAHHEELAHLCIARLHGTLDFGHLEQRGTQVQGDLELALGGSIHVLRELLIVLGVEVERRVGRGEVPLGLGKGAARKADTRDQSGGGTEDATFHDGS